MHHTIDKSGFPPGPWHNEPDELDWLDEKTGLSCRIMRNFMGSLCGYVAFKAPLSAFAKAKELLDSGADSWDFDVLLGDRVPHGGLTWAKSYFPLTEPTDNTLVVLGFDCAHAGDHIPNMPRLPIFADDVYRDLEYVKAEVTKLAHAIAEYKS